MTCQLLHGADIRSRNQKVPNEGAPEIMGRERRDLSLLPPLSQDIQYSLLSLRLGLIRPPLTVG